MIKSSSHTWISEILSFPLVSVNVLDFSSTGSESNTWKFPGNLFLERFMAKPSIEFAWDTETLCKYTAYWRLFWHFNSRIILSLYKTAYPHWRRKPVVFEKTFFLKLSYLELVISFFQSSKFIFTIEHRLLKIFVYS